MTRARRAAYKAHCRVRLINYRHQAEVRLPDGSVVEVWLVGGKMRVIGGDPISNEEKEILTEKVLTFFSNFSEQEQRILFA